MAVKQQLQYVRCDFGYVEWMLDEGAELSVKRRQRYEVLRAVYEQRLTLALTKVGMARLEKLSFDAYNESDF